MKWWIWVFPFIWLIFGITTHQSNQSKFWYDELLSIRMSGGAYFGPLSPAEIIANVADDRAWPPLSNLALAGWGYFVGWSEFAGRYLSALFGILAVAVLVQLGYMFGNGLTPHPRRYALVCSLMVLGSAFFVYYWDEMRGYTLYIFCTLASIALYWRLFTRSKTSWLEYVLFTLSLIALCYTHYIATITAISLGLYHVLQPKTQKNLILLGYLGVAGVAFLPWIGSAVIAIQAESTMNRGLDLPTIFTGTLYAFGNGIVILPIVLLGLSVFKIRYKPIAFLWWWVISGTIFILFFNHLTRFLFHPRHILLLILPFILLASAVFETLLNNRRWRWLAKLGLGGWLMVGLYQTLTPSFLDVLPRQIVKLSHEYLDTAYRLVETCAQPDDVIVFYSALPEHEWLNEIVMQYYFREVPQAIAQVDAMIALKQTDSIDLGFQYEQLGNWETRLSSLTAGAPTVWYVALPTVPPVLHTTQFETRMQTRYAYHTAVLENPAVKITAYTQIPTQERLLSCSPL